LITLDVIHATRYWSTVASKAFKCADAEAAKATLAKTLAMIKPWAEMADDATPAH
jgi:hypothetical protein